MKNLIQRCLPIAVVLATTVSSSTFGQSFTPEGQIKALLEEGPRTYLLWKDALSGIDGVGDLPTATKDDLASKITLKIRHSAAETGDWGTEAENGTFLYYAILPNVKRLFYPNKSPKIDEYQNIVAVKQQDDVGNDRTYFLTVVSSTNFVSLSSWATDAKFNEYGFYSGGDRMVPYQIVKPKLNDQITVSRGWRPVGSDASKYYQWSGTVKYFAKTLYTPTKGPPFADLSPANGLIFVSPNLSPDGADTIVNNYLTYYQHQGFKQDGQTEVVADAPGYMQNLIESGLVTYAVKEAHSGGLDAVVELGKRGKVIKMTDAKCRKVYILFPIYPTKLDGNESFVVTNEIFGQWFKKRLDQKHGPLFFVNASCTSQALTLNLLATVPSPEKLITVYTDKCIAGQGPITNMISVLLAGQGTYEKMRGKSDGYVFPDQPDYAKFFQGRKIISVSSNGVPVFGSLPP